MRIFLTIVFVIVCIALSVVVLLQEGKSSLGSLAGSSDTFWGKNKSRTAEGKLPLITKVLAVVMFLLALLLNMNLF